MDYFLYFLLFLFSVDAIYKVWISKKQLVEFPSEKIPEVLALLQENKRNNAIALVRKITYWNFNQSLKFIRKLEDQSQS